jgi:molybdenum cofactor cytidylyltransferase
MIGAIILAAGSSRRFGDDKRRAVLPNGQTIIHQSIENALRAFGRVLVVLRYGDNIFEQELIEVFGATNMQTFKAPESALGMGHSLANAIHEANDWEGAFIFLADMPHIKVSTLLDLRGEFEANVKRKPIIVPTHDGNYGHPVGFHQAYFKEIAGLTGDQGAKPVMTEHQDSVLEVAVDDAGILQDVDRPEDL